MKSARYLFIPLAACTLCCAQDAQGCHDSPLLTRFPGAVIDRCADKPDDSVSVRTAKQTRQIEGEIHRVDYRLPSGTSQAQLLRNVKTALQAAGYTMDYDSGNGDLNYHKNGTWILEASNMGGTYYSITTLKEVQLKQDMVADAAALSSGLSANGHVVVQGILFDTGKAEIKAESAPALREVVKMLQQDPNLKIYVVGHTDNVGAFDANLELSRQRAAAVARALTAQYGVAANRLQPFGAGPCAPVGSNDSGDGRALNRRVELVKQ